MRRAINFANGVHTEPAKIAAFRRTLNAYTARAVNACRAHRKRLRDEEEPIDLSDEALSRAARFTDGLPLQNYDRLLHLTPRLVNVVTVKHNFTRTPYTTHPGRS